MSNNTNYNVGVFYMPFWQYTDPNNPLSGNWGAVNDYDTFLVNNNQGNKARIPANIYYPSPQWYDETMPSVTSAQLQLMNENEIDFVVFDSYWQYYNNGNYYAPVYNRPIENLKSSGFDFHNMKFALSWANDFLSLVKDSGSAYFFDNGGLDAMIDYWKTFVDRAEYMTIDVIENGNTISKKVFYIYYPSLSPENVNGISTTNSIEGMCGYSKNDQFFAPLGADANEPYINNKKTKFLLDYIANRMGHPMYFVAVITPPLRGSGDPANVDYILKYDWLIQHPQLSGYSAVTTYGYKYFEFEDAFSNQQTQMCNQTSNYLKWSYNYNTMQAIYQRYYDYMINNSSLDYHVPVTAGFNRGPLNMYEKLYAVSPPAGADPNLVTKYAQEQQFADACNDYARDPVDQANSTPTTFRQSLLNAKAVVSGDTTGKTKGIVLISAWNEYDEGTVIEPTYTWGTQYLDAVKNVFQ